MRRIEGVEAGGRHHARHRARTVDLAVPHDRQRRLASGRGHGAGFWPPHLVAGSFDEARAIDENDGRTMARRAAREEGIFAGTSTGLNLVAALAVARELGPGNIVATVAVDTGLKYLAGDLYK